MLTVVTYNVWFDSKTIGNRLTQILSELITQDPTVICLQEVTGFIYSVLVPELKKLGYSSCYNDLEHFKKTTERVGYGVLILSKIPFASVNIVPFMNTGMGRYYVIVKLDTLGIYIVTTHLESLGPNKETRKSQIKQIIEFMNMVPNSILCMDSNFTDAGDDRFPVADGKIIDAFVKDGSSSSKKYTYDYVNNKHILGRYRSRLDRIYYCGQAIHQLDFDMFGTGAEPASDHYGLKLTCEVKI